MFEIGQKVFVRMYCQSIHAVWAGTITGIYLETTSEHTMHVTGYAVRPLTFVSATHPPVIIDAANVSATAEEAFRAS